MTTLPTKSTRSTEAAAPAGRGSARSLLPLSRRNRRAVLYLHVLASVSWIGVDLVMGALVLRGLTTEDPTTLATVFTALQIFCVPLLLTLGLLSLGTGLLLGFGTRFGVLRYWWVVVKLVGAVVLVSLVPIALRPTLIEGAAQATLVDASLADRLVDVRRNMVFPPIVSTATLVFLTWLAVYKPWGPTTRGRRFLKVSGRSVREGAAHRDPADPADPA